MNRPSVIRTTVSWLKESSRVPRRCLGKFPPMCMLLCLSGICSISLVSISPCQRSEGVTISCRLRLLRFVRLLPKPGESATSLRDMYTSSSCGPAFVRGYSLELPHKLPCPGCPPGVVKLMLRGHGILFKSHTLRNASVCCAIEIVPTTLPA